MRHLDELIPLSRRALSSALALAKEAYGTSVAPVAPGAPIAPIAVDATAGNGHDTLFLAAAIGEKGRVWAFDVQEAALAATRKRLEAENPDLLSRVSLVRAGHETAATALPAGTAGHLWAVTFNLGYLPGSDRRIVTKAATTLEALDFFASALAVGGVISVHAYLGHDGGEDEGGAVERRFAALPWETWRVAEYTFRNKQRNRETLFLAEKLA
ncbi:putative rRNA methylase YtqB [uncultured delta proteobacterium]|uniref:Putative rRNA methylase YtqB n=1 Tax=uncultured delta proteobacterium TaxID=34034 RepID=A0A212JZN7_9DELT|nr:putative rRNA methylase YtqB [uncultured delta proteobacterium]